MKKQMIWGLATLMLLLGIAAVFLFIDKDTMTEPEMTLGQPTKDLLNKPIPQPKTDVSITETDKPPLSEKAETSHVTVHDPAQETKVSHETPIEFAEDKEKYTLPDDVFSETYTEKLTSLVQTCVELYHLPKEIRKERGFDKAWIGMHNGRDDAQKIINHYYTTYDDTYLERYREIMRIVEPYKALVPRPKTPMPESVQRAKAMHPEMAETIDNLWR